MRFNLINNKSNRDPYISVEVKQSGNDVNLHINGELIGWFSDNELIIEKNWLNQQGVELQIRDAP